MNSNGNFAALEEYANQCMRFKKSYFESLDFREMYIKVLTQKGYSEDDTFFIDIACCFIKVVQYHLFYDDQV